MKVTVKTLKGGKFDVQVEESLTVAQVKAEIEKVKPELPAESIKLIHSGKVLKDTETLASSGVKGDDFLVVMVTKAKKAVAAPKPAAAAAAPTTPAAASSPAPAPAAAATATPAPTQPAGAAAPPAAPARTDAFPEEAVATLVAMGFPDEAVRHCLRAAHGNPDMAVEFLTNGIPEGVTAASSFMNTANPSLAASSSPQASSSSSGGAGAGQPLQALRNHPQFNDLRRLVQSNPQMLQTVLTQIGQQQPELLQEINANQALFLSVMNEPIAAEPPSSSSSSSGGNAAGGALPGRTAGSPAQMAQMIQAMSPEELQQMAQMMGLSPDQLRSTAQMIGQMPPEQLSQFMSQAMQGGGEGGLPGMMGGAGGNPQQVLRLTEEEMAAVDRLTEMGFDRSDAAQAFLACDKNEALAANLLMDSMAGGGFFGGNDGGGGGGGGGNDDDDDMYE